MTISSGIRSGMRAGMRSGFNPSSGGGGLAGVTQDATSGIYCPADATEWDVVLAAAGITSGGPSSLWLCQEASGSLADAIGGNDLDEGGSGYRQVSVAGWTRTGIASVEFDTSVHGGVPSLDVTQPYLVLMYGELTNRVGIYVGPTGGAGVRAQSANLGQGMVSLILSRNGSVTGIVAGAIPTDGAGVVQPLCAHHDGAGSYSACSNDELIVTAFDTPAGTGLQLFDSDDDDAGSMLYVALFTGSAATLTPTQIKTLLTTLGWTVGWSP